MRILRVAKLHSVDLRVLGLWVAALAVATFECISAFSRSESDRLADLHVYYGSVHELVERGTLYHYAAANGDPFTYPPFAGIVLFPIQWFSETLSAALWTISTVTSVFVVSVLISPILGRPSGAALRLLRPAVALILLASAPVASNIRFGQISWFLAIMVVADALQFVPPKMRGIATGVAAAIKLTPLIFIPYYWFSGQRRTSVVAFLTFTACVGGSWLILPGDSNHFWLKVLWQTSRIGDLSQSGNQSLTGMLSRLSVSAGSSKAILGILSLVLVACAIWRATHAIRNGYPLAAVAIVGCCGIAVSPVSWTHHQIWLVAAAVLSFDGRIVTAVWRATVILIMTIPLGTLLARLDVLSFVGENLRLLVAIGVVAILPFQEIRRCPTIIGHNEQLGTQLCVGTEQDLGQANQEQVVDC